MTRERDELQALRERVAELEFAIWEHKATYCFSAESTDDIHERLWEHVGDERPVRV